MKFPLPFESFYRDQVVFFRDRMAKYWKWSLRIFLGAVVAGIVFYSALPATGRGVIDAAFRQMKGDSRPWPTFLAVWSNNLGLGWRYCLAGLVPFYVISAAGPAINGALLGLVLAHVGRRGLLLKSLALILPHGLIEIATFVYIGAFSLYLSSQTTARILARKPPRPDGGLFGDYAGDVPLRPQDAISDSVWVFVGVILPLLTVAALLEAFLTPALYRLIS